ncbi:MAG: hypothetical protein M3O30_06800 [Planctomycetota bacterium]|nr:hypothetical protein [Planctomycetota bacterium]
MTSSAQNFRVNPMPILYELPGNIDFLSKPWLRMETRKGCVGGRDVEHLHHLGKFSIAKLCNSVPQDIPKYDLAEMNLICAYGLSGKHDIEIEAMLNTLDSWAARVADHTARRIGLFHKNRAKFGSLAQFRITAMIHVLTSEFNIHYNLDRITDPQNWDDPEDGFIHGLLGPQRHGTCASLPVLLTAIGRRLSYPIKLVTVGNHCFCRWDSPEGQFNIEYEHGGLNSHPDEFYTHWPHEWTPQMHAYQRKQRCWLTSLTPQEELAYCLHLRAVQLSIARRHVEAHATQVIACQLWPTHYNKIWVPHLVTKMLYPEENFPRDPCEETAGKTAFARLVKEKGAVVIQSSDSRAR